MYRHVIWDFDGTLFDTYPVMASVFQQMLREVVTAEQSFARKPDPSAIRYLMEKYDLSPAETIMIGDRELDVLAGHRAGIDSCLITERLPNETVATYTIQTFNQLSALLRTKT